MAFCMLMRTKKNYLIYLLKKKKLQELFVKRKQIISFRQSVLIILIHSSVNIYPCAHEEADTRIFIHVADATCQEFRRIIFWSNDSDVVLTAISCVQDLNLDELRAAYGIGKDLIYISDHRVALNLGPLKSTVLLAFYALTGWDTTSTLLQKARKLLGAHANSYWLMHCYIYPLEVDGIYRGIYSLHI